MDMVLNSPGIRWIDRVWARFFTAAPKAEDTPEDACARRAFIQDTLCANPDAFRSEHDVACMMHMYPGRF